MLGGVMAVRQVKTKRAPEFLDVVALLANRRADGLARGQVGTVVESLDSGVVLVEFIDDDGRPYAVAACPRSDLLVLHYVPQAA
jgi:Domain of unknown function (DUF4926)